MTKKILVLPGDGIGQEVCEAALPVLERLNLPLTLSFGRIGWECWRTGGDPVPEETWQQIRASDAVLLGAITSKGKDQAEAELVPSLRGRGLKYVSPVIQLRKGLDLFANIRPARQIVGGGKPFDICVVRENTEGLYAGSDWLGVPEPLRPLLKHANLDRSGFDQAAVSVRLLTRFGLTRVIRFAFEYARANGLKKVTLADKPNVLRESGQFGADIFHAVAAEFPDIAGDIQNVDAVALWLVRRPESFGVIVAENMFGDILSDLAGGIMGGLGLAPSANIGSQIPYFEPVHGSAPGMAGQGRANPSAMILTIALMLRHLGFVDAAAEVERAVRATIARGRTLTYDLGGSASTSAMAAAILDELANPRPVRRAAVITVDDAAVSGRTGSAATMAVASRLAKVGYSVVQNILCGTTQTSALVSSVISCLGQADVLVINVSPESAYGGFGESTVAMVAEITARLRGVVAGALGLSPEALAQVGPHSIGSGKALYMVSGDVYACLGALEGLSSPPA